MGNTRTHRSWSALALLILGVVSLPGRALARQVTYLTNDLQRLAVGLDECIRRGREALQAESYRSVGSSVTIGVEGISRGTKGVIVAHIRCIEARDGNYWANVVIASPINAANLAERIKLQCRMRPEMASGALPSCGYEVRGSPATVRPNEMITVNWTAPRGNPNDWIGLFRLGESNTEHGGRRAYIGEGASGVLTFKAPAAPGQYELRFLQRDSYTELVAKSTSITVRP